LGSVYGPNSNDAQFFECLERDISSLKNGEQTEVILAGDWNATWDPRPANNNIDVINMANIPSKVRTESIRKLANNLGLTDPFRALNPVRREFTYIPNARLNLNRSRIDFFLISSTLLPVTLNASINDTLSSTAFDHKKIRLEIGKKTVQKI
jgi:exonuclease III